MTTTSTTRAALTLIDGRESFLKYFRNTCSQARKTLYIFCDCLDPLLFNDQPSMDSISAMVRGHPKADVRLLVSSAALPLKQRLSFLELARRLPSKIKLRQLPAGIRCSAPGFILGDRSVLLYCHSLRTYQASYDSNAAAEARNLLEEFVELWERQSLDIADIADLRI